MAVSAVLLLAGCLENKEELAAGYVESGLELIEAGDWEKAELEFRNAIKAVPRNAVAHFNMGNIRIRDRNIKAAADHYFTALDTDPNYLEAHLRFSEIMMLAGDTDAAVKHADLALNIDGASADAMALKANLLFRNEEVQEAAALAQRAADADSTNVLAGAVLAAVERTAGNDDKALELLDAFIANNSETPEKALSLSILKLGILEQREDKAPFVGYLSGMVDQFPENLGLRRMLMTWHLRNDDIVAAKEQLSAISDKLPEDNSLALNVVRFVGATEGAEAARAELMKRIERAPEPFGLKLALANLDFREGSRDAAKASLQELISAGEGADANAARAMLAQFNFQEGDTGGAQALVDAILADDAKNIDGLALSAALKLRGDDPEGAILTVREALNEAPERADLLRLAARSYAAAGRSELAIDSLSAAVEASNYGAADVLTYAAALRNRGNLSAAEVILAEGSRRNRADRQILIQLAQTRLELGQWTGAEDAAARLRALDEDDSIAARIVAASLSGQDRFDESIEILSDVVENEEAGSAQPLAQLVRTLIGAGKAAEAIAVLDQRIAEDPSNTAAYVLKSGVLENQGDIPGAEEALKLAMASAPTNNASFVNLSNFYQRNGRSDEAVAVAREGMSKASQPDALGIQLAGLLEQQSDFNAAIEALEDLYRRRPDSVVVANNLASMLTDHRGEDPAVVTRALEIAEPLKLSDVPAFQDTYGWLLYLNGDYAAAIEKLLPAIEALPDNPWVNYHIGLTYSKLGENDKAREHLSKAISLGDGGSFARVAEAQAALEELSAAQ